MAEYLELQNPTLPGTTFYDEPKLSTRLNAASAEAVEAVQTQFAATSAITLTPRFSGDMAVQNYDDVGTLYVSFDGASWVAAITADLS